MEDYTAVQMDFRDPLRADVKEMQDTPSTWTNVEQACLEHSPLSIESPFPMCSFPNNPEVPWDLTPPSILGSSPVISWRGLCEPPVTGLGCTWLGVRSLWPMLMLLLGKGI